VRFSAHQLDALASAFNRDGIVVLRDHFDADVLRAWYRDFQPLLEAHVRGEQDNPNRGSQRFYVTLPFAGTFANPTLFEDDDVLAIVERVVGPDPVMCQLATDTPLAGSDYQAWHADTPLLFPETNDNDTPSFQLAVNFPLVDVDEDNGPLETTLGTHRMAKDAAMALLSAGKLEVQRVTMALGDVMIRDVRAIHRGTPNRVGSPRPMVVIGYSRRWLYRPEVNIRVPREVLQALPKRAQKQLRFNPVFDTVEEATRPGESYRVFAY